MKDIKIFCKKKKTTIEKTLEEDQSFAEEEKEEKNFIIMNIMKIFLRNKSRRQLNVEEIIL